MFSIPRWLFALPFSAALFLAAQTVTAKNSEKPKVDSGTYTNPVFTTNNPADPHVLLVDDTYYLYATTHGRGYDVYTSDDLVHWKDGGSVFKTPRGGAWAPDVFHNKQGDGKFYLYYTDNDPNAPPGPLGKQVGVAVSDSPLGPFEDKRVLATGSIDGHLFQDDDGKYYFYYVEILGGFKIFVQPMGDPLTPEGKRIEVIRPTKRWEMASGHVTEGPFMLKRNGTYYLTYSGSGADTPNYAIGYATSKSPLGPFKKNPDNPIAHRSKGIFGPGHHCVVDGPDGKMWMVYHQKYNDGINFKRFVAIDPIWFDKAGKLHARVTRDTKERAPKK